MLSFHLLTYSEYESRSLSLLAALNLFLSKELNPFYQVTLFREGKSPQDETVDNIALASGCSTVSALKPAVGEDCANGC